MTTTEETTMTTTYRATAKHDPATGTYSPVILRVTRTWPEPAGAERGYTYGYAPTEEDVTPRALWTERYGVEAGAVAAAAVEMERQGWRAAQK